MKAKTLACLVLAIALVGLAIAACGTGAPPEAPAEPAAPTQPPPPPTKPLAPAPPERPAESPCGDGVCDEVEQKNPALCPQDCEPTPTPMPEPQPATPLPDTPTPEPEVSAPTPPTSTPMVSKREAITLASGELAYLGDPSTITQEGGTPGESRQANLACILDGSGSMNAELPGTGMTRLAVAKQVMSELVPQIPAEVNGALWIYGHRYPQDPKEESCKDIERVFPLGPVDPAAYTQKINAVSALGYTPISDSIAQAARDLPAGDLNSIILVSDGEETCEGDPCDLAEALKASAAEVTVHVVGYAVEQVAREQLQCIAQVSGGTYHDAEDAAGLLQALEEAMAATVAETILRVELVTPDGAERHGNVRLSEAGTDRHVSTYITWKDNAVPPGDYDLLIDTLPWTLYPDLTIDEGSTTILRILLGTLSVITPEGEQIRADYSEAGTGVRLGFYGHEGPVPLVPGIYQVGINNSTSAPISVEAGEAKEIRLGAIKALTPDGEVTTVDVYDAATDERLGAYGYDGPIQLVPGSYYVSINNSFSGPISLEAGETKDVALGGIRPLTPDGEETSVDFYDAAADRRLGAYGGTVLLAPGTYYLVSHGSIGEPIRVNASEIVDTHLGAIQVDGSFTLFDATGKRLGAYGDTLLLMPGTYALELDDGSTVEDVVVEAGEVTTVK